MIRRYAKSRKWAAALLAVCFAAIFVIYGLYGLRWGPAFYTGLVLLFCVLVAAALDFTVYRRRTRELLLLTQRAGQYLGALPADGDPMRAQYFALTEAVEQKRRRDLRAAESAAAQARAYYTLWSHQIKTPIAAMGLLLRDDVPDRQAMELELLKMEQYADMALQYQRLGGPESDFVLRRCALDAVVRRAVRRVSPLFIGKQVRLELGELAHQVLTDEKWLAFVLEQVLTNAVKYTPPGGTVRVALLRETKTLLVEDTGIGIRPEDLPRVFEWGYTGGNGRLEQRATGVGLALCRMAMTRMGHTISMESELGAGSRVLLALGRPALAVE